MQNVGAVKKICVMTRNRFLFQKIRLELLEIAECVMCEDMKNSVKADVCLVDVDDATFAGASGLSMSARDSSVDIPLPFRLGALAAMFSKSTTPTLEIMSEERCARLGSRTVKLTDVEFSLLYALYKRGGEFVSRETLLSEVWASDADGGVVNVYIHYLREKLEKDGERVILASRGAGYRINEKFLVGVKR